MFCLYRFFSLHTIILIENREWNIILHYNSMQKWQYKGDIILCTSSFCESELEMLRL